jgi:endonuclease/exonuclease/phosphatase (EEP) superfamily protein YafD
VPRPQRARSGAGAPGPGWWSRVVAAAAFLYPIGLVVLVVALRACGERWWITGVGLYFPRAVFGAPLPVIVPALVASSQVRLLWTQALAATLLVFPLMGFAMHVPSSKAATSTPIVRVLSYNVESGTGAGGYPAIVQEIDRFSPDVVFLVEASPSGTLLADLHARYPTVATASQFVIASRFPVLETTTPEPVPYVDRPHSARYMRLVFDSPMGRLVGYAVHPTSPRESLDRIRANGRRGILSGQAFNDANAANFYFNSGLREAQVKAFAEAASRETDPVFIAGDTNLPELSVVLRHYLSAFVDGFAEAGWGFGYTFPSDKRVPPWMRIDRILASPALRFTHFEVGSSHASDHHCVVADLVLRSR